MDVIMWLWDREPYDGKRKHDVASIRGVTISGYISAARKQLELRTGERLIYTVLSKELVRRLKALPSPVRFKEPIPLSVVLALLNDTDISIGIRAAVALAWFLTLRLGESMLSHLTEVYNATRTTRREDVEFVSDNSGVINAVLLGALAGSGKLPIPDAAFEAAIRHAGKSIDTNLAAFAFGRGHARGELEQAVREHRKRQAAGQGVEDLLQRARRAFPATSLDVVEEGIRRLATYQDKAYAALYLDRLDAVHALGSAELLSETARHLAVRMSFEDVIRVAQAKTSAERLARVRSEVRAKEHEPLEITEHFKPGIEEIAAILPPGPARWLIARAERTGRLGKVYFSMHVRTTTVWGFARLRFLASLRWWRPRTFRFVEEQAEIDRWLASIRAAAPLGVELAREIAESARLIKGYGDTFRRGLANYRRIADEVIAPALAGRMTPRAAADAVASARVAALADPEGESLSKTLAAIAATATLRHAAE